MLTGIKFSESNIRFIGCACITLYGVWTFWKDFPTQFLLGGKNLFQNFS